MTKKMWRNEVKYLTPYVPGKPIEDVRRELGLDEVIRLASNENPIGPSPVALRAMSEALKDSWLYPEPSCRELREKLGVKYDVSADKIIVANGADHIITLIGNAYINSGDEVIYCKPTFTSYREITLLMGGIPIEIPLNKDFEADLNGILNAITSKTKLIFICNPNNPTGTVVKNDELESFLNQVPDGVLVILDEAYAEYISINGYRSGIDFVKKGYPVITIRTFSKFYGLAGVRIGYAVSSEAYLEPLLAVKQTFSVNRIAIAGALAALDDIEFLNKMLLELYEEKERLTIELQKMGFVVINSQANFLFVDMKQEVSTLFNKLMKKGILIRPCSPWSLKTFSRITIGTFDQNNSLINALKEIQQEMLSVK
ncbi:histidinol-phosphate transaminase [Neobacillus niacini]|uniref:histidinol-phosphate transaminase n=1 Tax=Neobacillus niacini TaxID=86668 RepID=UPI0005EDAC45|nr:histidinol-phosphate transaminase [Neobacillus niacini]